MVTDIARPTRLHWWPWVIVCASILAQITWILVPAGQRQAVTTLVVVLFAAASISHALLEFGVRWTAAFRRHLRRLRTRDRVTRHTTDIPFGAYHYTDELQPHLLGVPVIVPLAWLMMAYPSLVLARSLTTRWVVPLAAVGVDDLGLVPDPQMVGEGYWVWETKTPALPGIPGFHCRTTRAGWRARCC